MFMLCRNRVKDFTKWKAIFDTHRTVAHGQSGLRLTHMWREVDDPNNVFFIFAVEDRSRAEAFVNDPEAAKTGEIAGVIDGETHFVESVSL